MREAKCNSDLGNFASKDQTSNRFPYSVSHFASGLARVGHQDLFEEHDFGVPLSDKADRQDVLILYDSKKSLPSDKYVESKWRAWYNGTMCAQISFLHQLLTLCRFCCILNNIFFNFAWIDPCEYFIISTT